MKVKRSETATKERKGRKERGGSTDEKAQMGEARKRGVGGDVYLGMLGI